MDHNQAVELQLAVKYVLGELPPVQRDEYEDHYMDCPECAKDVHAAAAFADTAREVFREEARAATPEPTREHAPSRWLAWFRPVVAVPAMMILLAVIGYQNAIMLPHLKSAGKAQVFNSFPLMGAVRGERGEGGDPRAKVEVQKNETFALDFDFLLTPEAKNKHFDHYLGQLQDETGSMMWQVAIPAEKAGQEVHLSVPNGVDHAGKYSLVLAGDPGAKGEWVKANEVSRWNFVVAFRR